MAWSHQPQNSGLPAPFYARQNEASSSNYQGPSGSGIYRDATKREDIEALAAVEPILPKFRVYASVSDITYAPETALKEGVAMVNTIKEGLQRLELGSKLRQEVWDREVQKCVRILGRLFSRQRFTDDSSLLLQSSRTRVTSNTDCRVWR